MSFDRLYQEMMISTSTLALASVPGHCRNVYYLHESFILPRDRWFGIAGMIDGRKDTFTIIRATSTGRSVGASRSGDVSIKQNALPSIQHMTSTSISNALLWLGTAVFLNFLPAA
jgi:hypothetical protein